jgi:hypothetical protein
MEDFVASPDPFDPHGAWESHYRLAGEMECGADTSATPLRWQFTMEFCPPSSFPADALRSRHTLEARDKTLERAGAGSERAIPRPADHSSSWALLEAVQRLPRAAGREPLRFGSLSSWLSSRVNGVGVEHLDHAAGIPAAPNARGLSLRPLLEGKRSERREFVPIELRTVGRVIRTARYKYVRYQGDPVEQLFDLQTDPWETQNLHEDSKYAGVVSDIGSFWSNGNRPEIQARRL